MNIFVTHECPIKSARFLDNKRVIKMILDSAQLLSSAINISGGNAPYKSTHVNHPCSIWTRTSKSNYIWLLNHFDALCKEYTRRYQKIHKSNHYYQFFLQSANLINDIGLTPFPNCTTFKHITNVHQAYITYLDEKFRTDKNIAWSNI
jgi:hypothetical protein